MARVTRRPQAVADIIEVWDYIAEHSVDAARHTLPRFGRYVVFYTPLPDGIDVVRVLHGSRDIDALFGA